MDTNQSLIMRTLLFKIFYLPASLFFISGHLRAEPILGYDHLALLSEHYPVADVKASLPKNSALGFLWRTFGTDLNRVREILTDGNVVAARVHLLNGPGLRNRQLGPYESLRNMSLKEFREGVRNRNPKILNIFSAEAASVCEVLALEFPNVKIFCSPILEHNLSADEFEIVRSAAAKGSPSSVIVNNPMKGGSGPELELHGYPADQAQIVSLDGSKPRDGETPSSYAKRFPNSKIVFWWTEDMNCRKEGPWVDPRSRAACWSNISP